MSCFYMSPGIDEGAILHKEEFPLPRLPSISPFLDEKNAEALAYRALYILLTLIIVLKRWLRHYLKI